MQFIYIWNNRYWLKKNEQKTKKIQETPNHWTILVTKELVFNNSFGKLTQSWDDDVEMILKHKTKHGLLCVKSTNQQIS